jgi:hypothetical protein
MVDLQRGVQSYLIAKSSLEQDGYEPAPDTMTGARLNCGAHEAPRPLLATKKEFGKPQESSRWIRKFFCIAATAKVNE